MWAQIRRRTFHTHSIHQFIQQCSSDTSSLLSDQQMQSWQKQIHLSYQPFCCCMHLFSNLTAESLDLQLVDRVIEKSVMFMLFTTNLLNKYMCSRKQSHESQMIKSIVPNPLPGKVLTFPANLIQDQKIQHQSLNLLATYKQQRPENYESTSRHFLVTVCMVLAQ